MQALGPVGYRSQGKFQQNLPVELVGWNTQPNTSVVL